MLATEMQTNHIFKNHYKNKKKTTQIIAEI